MSSRSRSTGRSTSGRRAGAPPTARPLPHRPSTALLQAAAEDITFVHLLATQLGDQFASVADLPFGSQQDRAAATP